ncbi:hypothetical protein PYCCODRAFT_1431029 [Trametes coccinea BRFM310]|uniref:Uncharacterized protein n=1 Tax=Trametes coccinea (strain BRFM310) TaxID=1353009 RepID=A0A1Y2J0B4_TRAC3|nr:hypothetical protein PYCCODRAFT_1431029 [Trametes coccinea BRFM310]
MDSATQVMNEPSLARFLAEQYGAVKARFPGEGRRRWRLRTAEQFWSLSPEQKASYLASTIQNPVTAEAIEDADFTTDDDPLDAISDDAPGLGILLRTDYSDEAAWQAFYAKLQDAEAEFSSEVPSESPDADADMHGEAPSAAQGAASSSTDAEGDTTMDDEDAEGDDGDDAAPIFLVIDAPPAERAKFEGLSNLAALRLLNDVDARRAPAPPAGTKRIRPPNRLIDHDGWQEVYTGKTIWIYDAKSNQDHCVRLVSQKSAAMYGTATADSWRARVSHICELQVNLASGAMTIDFGGLDRWDYEERVRNLEEAVRPVS